MRSDMLWSDVERLQLAVQDQLAKFLPYLQMSGYTGQEENKGNADRDYASGFSGIFSRLRCYLQSEARGRLGSWTPSVLAALPPSLAFGFSPDSLNAIAKRNATLIAPAETWPLYAAVFPAQERPPESTALSAACLSR